MEILRKEWETSEGKEKTIIDAEFLEDGTLRISGADFGSGVEKWWGDYDYEYWMDIAPEDSKKLFLLRSAQLERSVGEDEFLIMTTRSSLSLFGWLIDADVP